MSKRMLVVLGLAVCLGVGFAGGQAAKQKKYPWASDAMNREITVVTLDFRCKVNNGISVLFPVHLNASVDLVGIHASPGGEGLTVNARIEPRDPNDQLPEATDANTFKASMTSLSDAILPKIQELYGDGVGADRPLAKFKNVNLTIYHKMKALAVRRESGITAP